MSTVDLGALSGQPRQADPGQGQPSIQRAVVTVAPATEADSMLVSVDRYSTHWPTEIAPRHWTPKGATLPRKGDVGCLIEDGRGDAWLVGWDGDPTSLPPSGPAGGSLNGSYPNPGIVSRAYSRIRFTGIYGNSLTAGVWTMIPFDTVDHDPSGWATGFGGADPGIKVPSAGDYVVAGQIAAAGAAITLSTFVTVNGVAPGAATGVAAVAKQIYGTSGPSGTGFPYGISQVFGPLTLAANDIVNLWAVVSGANSTLTIAPYHNWLAVWPKGY